MTEYLLSQFVPHDQSKKLYDAGFVEKCFRFWTKDNMFDASELRVGGEIPDDAVPAPLYQQAFDWFEKYKGVYVTRKPFVKDVNEFLVFDKDGIIRMMGVHKDDNHKLKLLDNLIEYYL